MFLRTLITIEQYDKLVRHYGEKKLIRANAMLEKYATRWELENVKLIPYYSVNFLWRANSKKYGRTVFKIHATVDHYTTREITLMLKGIPLYCELHESSVEDGVMLLKDAAPAQSLHEVQDLYSRLDAFLHVYQSIHITEREHNIYPSYNKLLTNILNWAEQHKMQMLIPYIDEAMIYYQQLKLIYNENVLLHGDLHHDNILLSLPNHYTVIDAKGVYDSRIFELPRFILNEFAANIRETKRDKIINIIKYLSHKLNIDAYHIALALCVESILSVTWTIQDLVEPNNVDLYIADHIFCRDYIHDFKKQLAE